MYTRRTNNKVVVLQPCFLDVLLRYIYNYNVISVFDACTARYIHLHPQEEECTVSSWGDSKMYKCGCIANSLTMLTEINKNGAIGKVRIWVESDTVKHLKAFRITSNEVQISLLILCWLIFYLLSYELKMFLKIFVSKVYRPVVLKNNS